jgi:peptidyl-prolyl cis-trans isomerase C
MMIVKFRASIALAVLATTLVGCSKTQTGTDNGSLGPGRVATVNGKPIAESVLRVYALASSRKNLDDLTAEERGKLLDDLIGVELLSQQADKEGLAGSRTVAAQLELQRLQLLGRSMATSYLDKNPATEDDLKKVYEENLPRLTAQEYKARHILVDTKDEAEGIIAQLRDGKDFAALAKEHANSKMGPNGSDLGWFTAQSMVPQIMTAIATMTVGAFSAEPVQTDYGYHVLILDDTRKGEPPTLEALRKDLTTAVERKRLEDYIKTLRSGAAVTLGP